tara:strand:+ start:1430 stop:1579 length:150 start_codon:yes stop_codon:yes gene_type:complete
MKDSSVSLPPRAWEALLEILESHNSRHGDFDIVTVMELHKQIKEQAEIK